MPVWRVNTRMRCRVNGRTERVFHDSYEVVFSKYSSEVRAQKFEMRENRRRMSLRSADCERIADMTFITYNDVIFFFSVDCFFFLSQTPRYGDIFR